MNLHKTFNSHTCIVTALFKSTCIVLALIFVLVAGYNIGRTNAIHQAELLNTTDTEYFINFGGEVHSYTFE